jgi:hypothetical protein
VKPIEFHILVSTTITQQNYDTTPFWINEDIRKYHQPKINIGIYYFSKTIHGVGRMHCLKISAAFLEHNKLKSVRKENNK